MIKKKLSNNVFIVFVFLQILILTIYYNYKKNQIFSHNSRSVVVIEENSEINNFSLTDLKKVLFSNNQILNSSNKNLNFPVSALLLKKLLEDIYEKNFRDGKKLNIKCNILISKSNIIDINNNFNRTKFTYLVMYIENSDEIKLKNCLDFFEKRLNSLWKLSLLHFLNEVIPIDDQYKKNEIIKLKNNLQQLTKTELVNKIYITNTHQSNNFIKFAIIIFLLILINLLVYFNKKIIFIFKKIF